jgi:hypothetical protein
MSDATGLPEITAVQRLEIRPGDRLVVTVGEPLTPDAVPRVQAHVRAALRLAPDFPVLVLPAGSALAAVNAGE